MMKLNSYYQERGIKKYMGFFLSEHTSATKKEAAINAKHNVGKEQMLDIEINDILDQAIMKSIPVIVQLNIKGLDDHGFVDDFVGMVNGYQGNHVVIGDSAINVSMIRNIELDQVRKWY